MSDKKYDLYNLELSETSLVDDPAQEPALAVIAKREKRKMLKPKKGESKADYVTRAMASGFMPDEADEKKRMAAAQKMYDDAQKMGDDVKKRADCVAFTSIDSDHQHGVRVYYYDGHMTFEITYAGSDEDRHTHEAIRNAAGELVLSQNLGHTHTVDMAALATTMLSLTKQKGAGMDKETEIKKEMNGKEILSIVNKALAMSASQRAYFGTLDADAKVAFINKSMADRAAETEAFEKSNPPVYTDRHGVVYRASDDARLVNKARESDDDKKQIEALKKANEEVVYKSRASELGHMPGDDVTRIALLKAIDTITDEEIRKKVNESLLSFNTTNAWAFKETGVQKSATAGASSREEAERKLDELTKARQKQKDGDYYSLYAEVFAENPELAQAVM